MRLKIRRPEKSTDKICSVCRGHKNLLEFYRVSKHKDIFDEVVKMNRQERRRLGVRKKDPMISIKQSDIDAMKEEATAKGCKFAFNLMLALPAMVIHDHYGELMRKDGRVERFVNLCMEQYRCYEEGYITLQELAKCLKDEAGVEIKGWY